ncbi:cell wall hydrolase [Iocasia frigidifontis]|uniref:Cell wall hydrolase n=1 Tax=Iocasia fonsfrigidae TaxID=2682810 RepID=A0A8A7KFP8_9FIRM|nr:cell wall hydrolase [Iocasia fonsfrigidae]QTL98329.1 cell wall hydrolase [Iocasia fonsfrigidae]
MFQKYLRQISILTLILLMFYAIIPVIPPITTYQTVKASIENNDVYRGMGIALLLIILSKIAQSSDSGKGSVRIDIDNPDYDSNEIDMLAKVIYAEARGEVYEGQVAVGAVVINRVKNPGFPDTITDVVYQPGQFTSVTDGQINLRPNDTAYRAARDAINGKDPSRGALFFYNPKTAETLWWLSTREKTVVIGNHVFAK